MFFTTNDAAVYEMFARKRAPRYYDQRTVLTTQLYVQPLAVTFTDTFFPVFSLPDIEALADVEPVFYRRLMYVLGLSGAEWLASMAGYLRRLDVSHSAVSGIFANSAEYLVFERKNRVNLGGRNHYMTRLVDAMIRDGVGPKIDGWPKCPAELIAFVD